MQSSRLSYFFSGEDGCFQRCKGGDGLRSVATEMRLTNNSHACSGWWREWSLLVVSPLVEIIDGRKPKISTRMVANKHGSLH